MSVLSQVRGSRHSQRDQEWETWNGLHMQNQSCFGGRLIVAPLVHLLLIPSKPMQLKLINNPLCYLTDQIIIREVQLKSCHTLIKKCSFNFFEQCSMLVSQIAIFGKSKIKQNKMKMVDALIVSRFG